MNEWMDRWRDGQMQKTLTREPLRLTLSPQDSHQSLRESAFWGLLEYEKTGGSILTLWGPSCSWCLDFKVPLMARLLLTYWVWKWLLFKISPRRPILDQGMPCLLSSCQTVSKSTEFWGPSCLSLPTSLASLGFPSESSKKSILGDFKSGLLQKHMITTQYSYTSSQHSLPGVLGCPFNTVKRDPQNTT